MITEENNKRVIRAKMDEIEANLNDLIDELESLGFDLGVNQTPENEIHQLSGKSIKIPKRFHLTAIKTNREII